MIDYLNDQPSVSFGEGYKKLEEEIASGTKPLPEAPSALPLGSIKTAKAVLQPRIFSGGEQAQSTDHVERLAEAIRTEKAHVLDPLLVWWSGKHWRVIDGHHRLEAYQQVLQAGRIKLALIPVTAFHGTLDEAMAEAVKLNAKDKLPMTKSDKLNRAWQFTVLEKFTKAEITALCKVSNGTVGNMRDQLAALKVWSPQNWKSYAQSHTWEDVLAREEKTDRDNDEWVEKQAQDWAKRLGKTFGSKFAERGQIAARALEIYSPKLVHDLMDEWGSPLSEDDEELPF